jgi:S1-C subfamily serine protease
MKLLPLLFTVLPALAGAQTITGIRMETTPAPAGRPVTLLVDIDKAEQDTVNCGAVVNFGDGVTLDVRIEGANFPHRVLYQYAKPGSYAVTIEGKTLMRGLRTASACGGPMRSTVAQIGGPVIAAAPPQQPHTQAADAPPESAAPAPKPAPRPQQSNVPDPDFYVVNRSQKVIGELFVSSVQSPNWGEDLIPGVLKPGERFLVKLPRNGQCAYDVRVIYDDKSVEERRKQDVCKIDEMAFTGQAARAEGGGQTTQPASGPRIAGFGTGFFVSGQGHALTNNHVITGCERIASVLEGQYVPSIVVQVDRQNDLALIRAQLQRPVPFARFRSGQGIRVGEDVVAAGFPFPQVLQNGLNVTRGNVSAMGGIGGNTANMQMTAPVQPGNSGGPLFDGSGNVVGVVVARLNPQAVKTETQNINYAVQGAVARLFLESNGVRAVESPSLKDIRVGDLSDAAREFTFQIVCYK